MKKYILFSLFIFISLIVNSSLGQSLKVRDAKQKKNSPFNFPVVLNQKSVQTAKKINEYLQLTFCEQTTTKCNEEDLFDLVHEQNLENGIITGLVGTSYKVNWLDTAILSLTIYGETEAAYPDYFQTSFNFNSATGDIVLLEDLFNLKGIGQFKSMVQKMRGQKIKKHIYHLRQEKLLKDANEEEDAFLNEFINCISTTTNFDFWLTKDSIHLSHPRCLPHVAQALDGDFSVSFSLNEITSMLNSYGQKLLISRKPVSDAFHQSNFERPLFGHIGKIHIVLFLNKPFNQTLNGYYYYCSEGKAVYCFGSFEDDNISLQCSGTKSEELNETISGKLSKNGFIGTWKQNNQPQNKTLPIKVN